MIKLIATDLDGTLLNKMHQWDDKIIDGVHQILEAGCYFVVATGRDVYSTNLASLKDKVHLICMNGAQIIEPSQKVLHISRLNPKIIKNFCERFSYPFIDYANEKGIYHICSREDYEAHQEEMLEKEQESKWVRSFIEKQREYTYYLDSVDELIEQKICKINFKIPNEEVQNQLDDFLKKYPQIHNTPFMEHYAEITDFQTNKANAISWLAQSLGISEEEVAVYGDGGNDVNMLRKFSHSYAPCTASSQAKEAAREIIGPYDEYSVIEHMKQMIKK